MTDALPRRSRAALYRLCADLLTHEVDAARLQAIEGFSAVLGRAEPGLGPWLETADDRALAALREEFARLFLLPRGVSPRAGVWLSGGPEHTETRLATLVHRAMAALELEQTSLDGTLAADHLALLYSISGDALASDVPARVRIGEHVEREALGDWIVAFGRALEARSREPLYRALGKLLQALHATKGPRASCSASAR